MLQDGTVFEGVSIGARGVTGGELCYNTGMSGYQEIYTDPSYYGQILVNTHTHIGNYGVHEKEVESGGIQIRGLVVREFSSGHSRWAATGGLAEYMERHGLVGIGGVDTRGVVRHLREKGSMNAVIAPATLDKAGIRGELDKLPSMEMLELASRVSCKCAYEVEGNGGGLRVAVLDLGIKASILSQLAARGFRVKVFPSAATFGDMESWDPDAYLVSNGPGDPAAMDSVVSQVRGVVESGRPMFGICLGHQLLARAVGMKTFKMPCGHRGLNHPVRNLETGKCEITSQNHGFAVDSAGAGFDAVVTHLNLNDQTVEGIRLREAPAFSVQYHPEASPGPHDSNYLFEEFFTLTQNHKK